MSLYIANDINIELLGLTTEDGAYVTDAAISCVIIDPTGNSLATVSLAYLGTSVSVGGQTYKDGNYRGVLSGSNSPALVAGTIYTLSYSASNYGLKIVHYETAQARVG
ncbi:MAG: hypothetical protein ACREHD_25055 [Pirellulales bacterium]